MLTPRRAAFVREWQVDHNGTRAAIRAGFAVAGASVTASRLLADARIQAELAKVRETTAQVVGDALEEAPVTASAIVRRAWQIASSDARDRVPALAVAARAFPEFRDALNVNIDARTLVVKGRLEP